MKQIEYARQMSVNCPDAPASWMTNAELFDILTQLADLREALEVLMTVSEPHPVEQAQEIEQVIDAQLPYTRVFNPYLNGSVRRQIGYGELMHDINDPRYCSEVDERDGCGTDSDLYDYARGG